MEIQVSATNLTFNMLALSIIIVLALMLINIGFKKKCPEQEIIYIEKPRSFEEEQKNPTQVSSIFKKMFNEKSVLT